MSSRKVTLLTLAVVCSVSVVGFATVKMKTWRQSRQISREIAWIQDAVQQLQKSPPPSPDLAQSASTGRWETASLKTDRYLIFSNGWAVCRTHSWHRNDGMDDIAVLKLQNGGFYLSRHHFEFGIELETLVHRPDVPEVTHASEVIEMLPPDGSHSQPADSKDFLENGARWQGWYQFSPDGNLQCVVRSPHEDNRLATKSLWVWIGSVSETNSSMLFEKRYSIASGRDMSWTANWASDNEITLDVFDYGGNSPMMMGHDFPKRLLATLIFQRDKENGMFTEKTNILRFIPKLE